MSVGENTGYKNQVTKTLINVGKNTGYEKFLSMSFINVGKNTGYEKILFNISYKCRKKHRV